MEVELKVRLPDLTTYQQALALFQSVGQYQRTEHQVNYFFDGSERELQKSRTVFRLREVVLDIPHSGKAVKATATIKGNAVLENGVSTVEEEELPIAQSLLQALVAHPEDLSSLSSTSGHPLLAKLLLKLRDVNDIAIIGSYRTKRDVFSWSQLQIELDKTEYTFGDAYEIEIESSQPQTVRRLIENLLDGNHISYTFSQRNKVENMLAGSVL